MVVTQVDSIYWSLKRLNILKQLQVGPNDNDDPKFASSHAAEDWDSNIDYDCFKPLIHHKSEDQERNIEVEVQEAGMARVETSDTSIHNLPIPVLVDLCQYLQLYRTEDQNERTETERCSTSPSVEIHELVKDNTSICFLYGYNFWLESILLENSQTHSIVRKNFDYESASTYNLIIPEGTLSTKNLLVQLSHGYKGFSFV